MGTRHAGHEQKGAVALEAIPVPTLPLPRKAEGQDGPGGDLSSAKSRELLFYFKSKSPKPLLKLSLERGQPGRPGVWSRSWAGLPRDVSLFPPDWPLLPAHREGGSRESTVCLRSHSWLMTESK